MLNSLIAGKDDRPTTPTQGVGTDQFHGLETGKSSRLQVWIMWFGTRSKCLGVPRRIDVVFHGGRLGLVKAAQCHIPPDPPVREDEEGHQRLVTVPGPRPNFLDHQEGVINGRQSYNRPGYAGGEPLRSSRRSGEINPMLLLKGAAARVENA